MLIVFYVAIYIGYYILLLDNFSCVFKLAMHFDISIQLVFPYSSWIHSNELITNQKPGKINRMNQSQWTLYLKTWLLCVMYTSEEKPGVLSWQSSPVCSCGTSSWWWRHWSMIEPSQPVTIFFISHQTMLPVI